MILPSCASLGVAPVAVLADGRIFEQTWKTNQEQRFGGRVSLREYMNAMYQNSSSTHRRASDVTCYSVYASRVSHRISMLAIHANTHSNPYSFRHHVCVGIISPDISRSNRHKNDF